MEIIEVKTKKDTQDFIALPWAIYKAYPHWIPPLKKEVEETLSKEKNPFFEHSDAAYFLVKNGPKTLGRIAAVENRNHNNYHKDRVGFFGFFECVENFEAAKMLFDAAKGWCASRKLDTLRGPASFSTNDECGLLIEGFDKDPVLMMPYNPPYYAAYVEQCGLRKAKDLFAFYLDTSISPSPRVLKIIERIKKKSIILRQIRMREFKDEIKVIMDIYNSAWSKNWGFVPMTGKEIEYMSEKLKPMSDPNLIYIVEVSGTPAAFVLMMRDYYKVIRHFNGKLGCINILKLLLSKKGITSARLMALGVKEEFRHMGIELMLCHKILEIARDVAKHIKTPPFTELSWTLEDNVKINAVITEMGGVLYKKYRIYDLAI